MLVEGLFWNSSARIEKNIDDKTKVQDSKEPFKLEGNVTEQGIIKFFLNYTIEILTPHSVKVYVVLYEI